MKFLIALLFPCALFAQHSFDVIPLGVRGGLEENNLSAYLIGRAGSENYVCVDAGTIRHGIDKSIANKVFKVSEAVVLRSYIRGYLVSHGHLDHVSGLIINSPDDSSKTIYAMPYVLDVLRDKYFTWESWANFADQGGKPALGKYHYQSLEAGSAQSIANTDLVVKAFVLSHSSPYQSTAFLIDSKGNYLLYLGDTGADRIEKSSRLAELWQAVADIIKSGKLKAICIEVSYPNEQPEQQLFGHLTPRLLMEEFHSLAKVAGNEAMKGLNVVITHIKPAPGVEERIKKQLKELNDLGLRFTFPEQGRKLQF